ncbi:hypothetical protein OUZ56_003520 [Daphnia magna]|uniref:Uncharacterized protein n=1 Tax=Daphnia magna TaxID=35525 RepID=A0ABR0A9C8_9CRUS|nr:hypothetical protein OUZ56_003520 [Daphnia magna]
MRETRAEIAKYNSSIRGTGGGPQYRLKHIDEKIRDQVIGINNPSLPGHVILGGVESETAPSEVDNHDLGAVEILDDTHYTIAIEFKQEQSLGQESCSAATPRPIPTLSEAPPQKKTSRQATAASKRFLCEVSDEISRKRLLREKIKLAQSVVELRAAMGNPMTLDEFPEELKKVLADPWNHKYF